MSSAVASLLESSVLAVDRVPGCVSNQDFVVRTTAGDYVVKAGDGASLAVEAWACRHVAGLGVSAPEIVAVQMDSTGPLPMPMPFIVMRHLRGSPLTPHPEIGRAVVQAGAQLRTVHTTRLAGYGQLRYDPTRADQPAGRHETWAGFLAEPLAYLDELVAHDVLRQPLAERLRTTFRRAEFRRTYEGPGVLLHGDLQPRHLFAERGELTGIIDWGDALAGDPLFDLAPFAVEDARLVAELLDGYGLRLTRPMTTLMTFYRIVRTTLVLVHEFRSGGDWFAAYRSRLEADLDQLASATAR